MTPKPKPASSTAEPETPATAEPAEPKRERPDPTRYGDWEMNGRCIDF